LDGFVLVVWPCVWMCLDGFGWVLDRLGWVCRVWLGLVWL
jgi:hypothetical protein